MSTSSDNGIVSADWVTRHSTPLDDIRAVSRRISPELFPMTEAEWLTSTDPAAMLNALDRNTFRDHRGHGLYLPHPPSARKLRLFACACCRQVWEGIVCPRQGCDRGVIRSGGGLLSEGETCPNCHGSGRIGGITDPRSRNAVEVAERYADGLATKGELFRTNQEAMCRKPGSVRGSCPSCAAFYASQFPVDLHRVRDSCGVPDATQANLLREIFGNPWRPVKPPQWCADGPGCHIHGFHWLTPTVTALAQTAYDERLGEECEGCFGSGKRLRCKRCRGTYDPEDFLVNCPMCPDSQLQSVPCDFGCDNGLVTNGTLDPARLAILADALEEAGCTNATILQHLRGRELCACEFPITRTPHPNGLNLPCTQCRDGWRPLRIPHHRGCWVLDLLLGKE